MSASDRSLSAADRMLSGAFAGAISRTVTAPLDRVRILYQVNPNRDFSLKAALKTARTIYDHTGTAGLWRGNGASLVRVMPYSGVLFCAFPTYEAWCSTVSDNKMAVRFFAGAAAGATATTVTYPLDLMRARMAAHWGPKPLYTGYLQGMREIVAHEGFAALFRGITPTLIGIVPYSGIGFTTFETLKSGIRDRLDLTKDSDIPTVHRLAAGGVSGLVSQSLTYPLHVIRRRMQVGGSAYHKMSLFQAVATIWKTEGANGLFKGITLTYAKGPVAVALGFTLNDIIQTNIRQVRTISEEANKAVSTLDAEDARPLSALEGLGAGALAGCVAKTAISPADRVKILFQVGQRHYTLEAAIGVGRTIVQEQGILALWRGNGATMLRVIPYSGTTYLTYDRYLAGLRSVTEHVEKPPPQDPPRALHVFCAGSLAGATASTVSYPLDLLRARMAVQFGQKDFKPRYGEALVKLVRENGVAELFAGLKPTVAGIIPYAGLSFLTFETLKASIRERLHLKRDRDIPTPLRLMSGGLAGLVAQSATYPLDILRRRMQVGRLNSSLTIFAAFRHILATEGIRALYRGLSMNWLKGPIAISVSFTTNDLAKSLIRDYHVYNDMAAAETKPLYT